MRTQFRAMDANGDGKLQKEEVTEAYKKLYKHMSEEEVKEAVDDMFNRVDIDGSGEIDYTEWVMATIDKKSLLTEEKMKEAFKIFDKVSRKGIDANRTTLTQYQWRKSRKYCKADSKSSQNKSGTTSSRKSTPMVTERSTSMNSNRCSPNY